MNYALVVGIDHYPKRPLKGAVADATEFGNWLLNNDHVSRENLKMLVSGEGDKIANFDDIDTNLRDICKQAEKFQEDRNRFYFYFSGHGMGVSYTNTALCLRLWDNDLINYNISSREYQDTLINKAIFDEIIIFLDCCRDYDPIIEPHKPSLDSTALGQRKTNVLICYSTVYGKLSYEVQKDLAGDPNNKRGAFTSFLLEGLKGDADHDGDGSISGSDLKKHILDNFKSYALKYSKEQAADYTTFGDGDKINICSVAKNVLNENYAITFKRKSNISIFDGSNNPISGATTIEVDAEQVLKLRLPKGLFKIVDNNSKEEKYFTNYNPDTHTNEQF